jgi:hypothetical protein
MTCLLLGCLATAGGGCLGDSSPTASSTVLVIDPGAGTDLFLDAVDVDSVWVMGGETLRLQVTYGGGCETHTFRLVGKDAFGVPTLGAGLLPASSPLPDPGPTAPLDVYLIHDANEDACRSLVSRTLAFDVSAASRLRRDLLDRDGFVSLLVHTLARSGEVTVRGALMHTGIARSPRDDVEAERMAAFRGDITADDRVYAAIRDDLAAIRDAYGDEVTKSGRPMKAVTFRLPWEPRQLLLTFDAATADAVAKGTYHGWDTLNRALGVESTEIVTAFPDFVVRLRFSPEVNVCALVPVYFNLPGLAAPPRLNRRDGDGPNIYAGLTDDGLTYLVEEAWGDCPSGCLHSDDWFFESVNGKIVFHGRYDPDTEVIPPVWWSTALDNIAFYEEQCAGF